jgi:hypothetical protein
LPFGVIVLVKKVDRIFPKDLEKTTKAVVFDADIASVRFIRNSCLGF